MKKRDDVLVGLLVAVTIVVAIVGSLWLARGGLSKGYPLYAKFPWGAGLKQGQPVWLVGVSVGYVDNVELKQNGILITTLRIDKQYKVPLGSTATVVTNGIFGDMAVALTPVHPDPRSFSPGDTVPVGPTAPGIAQLTSKADSIATSVNAITTAMQHELVAAGGIRELHQTVASTNRLVAEFADMSNTPGAPDVLRHKNEVIDTWCAKLGRDPRTIERTCNIPVTAIDRMHEWVEAGAQRLQIQLDHPFDLGPVERALQLRDEQEGN